jgi:murein DD-endopeptidase MepM/ murein hydrolase activator NlpD
MSSTAPRRSTSFAKRKPPHRVIIARGGEVRTFTVKPWLAGSVVVGAAVFGVLYLAATGYLFFRDDILAASIAEQTQMKQAYEERIATLRSDIDRLTSHQLLGQQQLETELDRLSGRQAALDARQDVIAGLSQAARRVGIAPAAGDAVVPGAAPAADKAATADAPAKAGTKSPLADAAIQSGTPDKANAAGQRISAVESSLDSLARDQVAYVDTVATRVMQRSQKIAAILNRLGQKVPPSHAQTGGEAIGGPLVELQPDTDPATFRASVSLVTGEVEHFGALRRIALRLPLTRPISGAPITSRFGVRVDPFLGTPAMHTGIDFRAPTGYPARATADGTVTMAGYDGGYGNMVEIDHGNGVTTRYGHLSKIDVTVGQVVSKGTVLGRTGSTGRSTGPHLHYEVRVDGDAIDPMQYITAGSEIAALL